MFNIWGKGGDGERPRRMSRDNRGFVFYLLALFLNSELIHSGLSLVVFLYKVLFGQIRFRRCRIQSKFIFRSHDDPKCAQLLQTKFRANLNTDPSWAPFGPIWTLVLESGFNWAPDTRYICTVLLYASVTCKLLLYQPGPGPKLSLGSWALA